MAVQNGVDYKLGLSASDNDWPWAKSRKRQGTGKAMVLMERQTATTFKT